MEFKNSFWNRLFSSISKQGDGKNTPLQPAAGQQMPKEEQTAPQEVQESKEQEPKEQPAKPEPAFNQLILPQEHPFILLYELWTEDVPDAPLPHLRLDCGEDSTDEAMEEELARLRKAITAVAADRLKEIPEKLEEEILPEGQMLSLEEAEAMFGKADVSLADGEQGQEISLESLEALEELPIEMDALPAVYVTADQMAAWIVVFPPVGQGKVLDREMLDNVLKENGVTFGIDTELLDRLPDAPDRYFHLFPVAKGQPVVHGKDGYIEDFYKRSVKTRYEEDEHGRVDYFNLNIVQNVEKGGVICQMIPPVEGTQGRTVLDKEIPCKEGKVPKLPKGRNTEISEDGLKLLAVKNGRVEYSEQGFKVKSVLEIDGNVDFSTGNINFVGDVHIHGDVSGGFSVHTIGDITVDGVVEAAELEAGGDVIVAKGILGDSRAVIRASHDIYAKYIENCMVHSRGNLQSDCLVNCNVFCDGEVNIRSGRGIIVGGRIRAAQGINAKVIGSKSESVTTIYLGGQPCADYEREILVENIKKMETDLEKLERQPDSPAKTQRMGKLKLDLSIGRMKVGQFDKELKKLKQKLAEQGGCRLRSDIAYPGMVLNIENETFHLTKETSCVNGRLVNGEIKIM